MDSIQNIRVIHPAETTDTSSRNARPHRASDTNPAPEATAPPASSQDTLELSKLSMKLAGKGNLNDIRAGLVDSVRRQISQGSYDSPEKLGVAVDRILADLNHIDLVV